MLATTEGIVLYTVKYGENSIIATIYTRELGRQGFLLNAVHGKKNRGKAAMLQPMTLVHLVAYEKQLRELQRIKEISVLQGYQTIPFDVVKSSQAIFLAEMLFKTIREQEGYPELFDFIKHAFLFFDLMTEGIANFHLYFLFRLTEYLGFMPDLSGRGYSGWFDMRRGEVVPWEPSHPMFLDKGATLSLVQISELKINALHSFKVTNPERGFLLKSMVTYYQLHFGNLGEIKSLYVLEEVFS